MRKTIFTFLILALSVTALGQTNTQRFCSGDPLNYVKEVEKYLDFVSYGGRNDLIKKIEKTWNSDFYTDHQKGRIIEITNNLIEGKVRTTPDFVNFLNVVNLYPNMGADVDYFNNWFEIIEGYLHKLLYSL